MGEAKGIWILMAVAVAFMVVACLWVFRAIASEGSASSVPAPAVGAEPSFFDFRVRTIDGEEVGLDRYRGKAVLVVNTASRCGFTQQYEGLQKLYRTYRDRGFEVLAFPANNFMGQEPGTDAEIKEFCSIKFRTEFPLFSKISVKGGDIHPLYRYLTTRPGFSGDIAWNFTKFLIGPDGQVVGRFGSRQDPQSAEVVAAVETLLARTRTPSN